MQCKYRLGLQMGTPKRPCKALKPLREGAVTVSWQAAKAHPHVLVSSLLCSFQACQLLPAASRGCLCLFPLHDGCLFLSGRSLYPPSCITLLRFQAAYPLQCRHSDMSGSVLFWTIRLLLTWPTIAQVTAAPQTAAGTTAESCKQRTATTCSCSTEAALLSLEVFEARGLANQDECLNGHRSAGTYRAGESCWIKKSFSTHHLRCTVFSLQLLQPGLELVDFAAENALAVLEAVQTGLSICPRRPDRLQRGGCLLVLLLPE